MANQNWCFMIIAVIFFSPTNCRGELCMYLSLFLGTIPRFTTRSILNVWKTIAISKQVEKRSYFTTSFKNTEVELQTMKLENWTSKVEKNIFNVLCLPASTNLKSELMFFDMLQLVIQERGFYPRVLNPKLPELIELNGYPTRKYPWENVCVRNPLENNLSSRNEDFIREY